MKPEAGMTTLRLAAILVLAGAATPPIAGFADATTGSWLVENGRARAQIVTADDTAGPGAPDRPVML